MEEIKIGVYVCWCGTNIAKMVDVKELVKQTEKISGVTVAKDYKYMCSNPGQEMIINDIRNLKLNRIVVAACSPRIHEGTFRKAIEEAGLNQCMFQMANIREQVSWVHTDHEKATKKAISLVAAAVNRVKWHESLEKRVVDINPATLIIGGGIAGISAALLIGNAGKQVYLVEKEEKLGGNLAKIDLTYPFLYSASQLIDAKIKKVLNHPNIKVFLNAEIEENVGYVGNFESTVKYNSGKTFKLEFGNIIMATGLKTFDPGCIEEYKYGKFPDVITSLEFEQMLKSGKILTKDGKEPGNVAIIHCVGSRNEKYHEYCSRMCCMVALKYANQIRGALPDTNIFEAYTDMRSLSKGCEELYTATSRKNVTFLMFDPHNGLPEVKKANEKDNCSMLIEMNDLLSGEDIEVPADLIILMVAMEAREDAKKIAHLAGISLCGNDLCIEKHPKLDPVATTNDGIYVVGSCQAPKNIFDSISQARAASARVLASINVGKVEVEVITSQINEKICCGCQTCVSVCPYKAISYNEEKNVSEVNEILCKGCGTCGSTCPTGAVRTKHFTDRQILSQIDGLFEQLLETEEV